MGGQSELTIYGHSILLVPCWHSLSGRLISVAKRTVCAVESGAKGLPNFTVLSSLGPVCITIRPSPYWMLGGSCVACLLLKRKLISVASVQC